MGQTAKASFQSTSLIKRVVLNLLSVTLVFVKRKPLGSSHRSLVRGQSKGDGQMGLGKCLTNNRTSLLSPAYISENTDRYGIY